MAYLIDVNVLLALMHERHQHAPAAAGWLQERDGAGIVRVCRVAQMGTLRLLTNEVVMGDDVLSGAMFWRGWDSMMEDDRFAVATEPAGFERAWRDLSAGIPKGRRIETDHYFAAFATSGNFTMATFDDGFRRFPKLKVEILGS
jgi:uncharacterized protein